MKNKNSDAASRWSLFDPTYTFTTRHGAENGLPVLSESPLTNKAMWNMLAVGGGSLLLGALISSLAHETSLDRFRRKNREGLEAKLNSIMPIANPDTDLDDSAERHLLRTQELTKTASGALGDFGARIATGALPMLALAGGAYTGHKIVSELYENKTKEDLKNEIEEYENELEALQARLLAAQSKSDKKDKTLDVVDPVESFLGKDASDDGGLLNRVGNAADNVATVWGITGPSTESSGANRGAMDMFVEYPFITAAIIAAAAGAGGYQLFRKKNETFAKAKVMEELAATNLSNIPPRLSLSLDEKGNPIVVGDSDK